MLMRLSAKRVKSRSHCDGNGIFLCRCRCRHEWVQYPFITATAMEKMGIMELSHGDHTAAATVMEKIEFLVLSGIVAAAV